MDKTDKPELLSLQDVVVYHWGGHEITSILAITLEGMPFLRFYKIIDNNTFAIVPFIFYDKSRTSRFSPSVRVERLDGESQNIISVNFSTHVQFQRIG